MEAGSVLLVLLAALGICALVRGVFRWALRGGRQPGTLTITLRFRGHREDAEYVLRSALSMLDAAGAYTERRLLVLDDGMDAQTRAVCEGLLQAEPRARICTPQEVGGLFAKTPVSRYTEKEE